VSAGTSVRNLCTLLRSHRHAPLEVVPHRGSKDSTRWDKPAISPRTVEDSRGVSLRTAANLQAISLGTPQVRYFPTSPARIRRVVLFAAIHYVLPLLCPACGGERPPYSLRSRCVPGWGRAT
jgi:hypothetical protein